MASAMRNKQPDDVPWFGKVRTLFLRCLMRTGRRMSPLLDKPANSPPEMLK